MKRWPVLVVVVIGVAFAMVVLGRAPRRAAEREAAAAPAAETAVTFRLRDGGVVEPRQAAVAKDHLVRLTLVNESSAPVSTPRLPGYEDRVTIPALAPGESWSGAFTADRPGTDFALWIDGEPVARLLVQGSHLVEGHR